MPKGFQSADPSVIINMVLALSLIGAMVSLIGCPPASDAPNPNLVPIIPITEDMEPVERAIVQQLNTPKYRDTSWYGNERAELLRAWVILKDGAAVELPVKLEKSDD